MLIVGLLIRTDQVVGQVQKIQINVAQQGQTESTSPPLDVATGLIVADREHVVRLTEAKKLIAERQHDIAVVLLQQLLNGEDESAYAIDKERTVLRNLQSEAERLIGDMPASVLKDYARTYNADARQMLREGIDRVDRDMLTRTSRQYFYTPSGYDATFSLAWMSLDIGRPFEAATWFERLRQRRHLNIDDRKTLALHTAIAWAMADRPSLSVQALADLKSLAPKGQITFRDRAVKIFDDDRDSLAWLYREILARQQEFKSIKQADLPDQFPSTTAWQTETGKWRVPVEEAPFTGGVVSVTRQLHGLEKDFHKRNLAAIPTTRPLIVGDVAVVRTPINLRAYDLESGEILWQSEGDNALEQVRRGVIPPLPGDTGSILDPMLADRVFNNSTYGTMTAVGGLVVCLEDVGFITPTNNVYSRNRETHPLAIKPHNRMCAFDVNNGQLKWELGGNPDGSKLALPGHYFLGTPIHLGRQLLCVVEVKNEIRLISLDANSGKLNWFKPLHTSSVNVANDEYRGTAGLIPAFADGVLVCPTGAGLIVGVDLATRQILWSYRYRELEEGGTQDRIRRMMMARIAAARGTEIKAPRSIGRWTNSAPLIADGRVFVTPRDTEELLCLNLEDGSLQWKVEQKHRALVADVYRNNLVVLGNRRLEMLDTATGLPGRPEPLEIGMPSGRGLLVGNKYHVPVSSGARQAKNRIDDQLRQ